MVTVEQILAAEGEELSGLLGEVLQGDGPFSHTPVTSQTNGCVQVCVKCNSEHAMMDGSIYEKTCDIPDPIPLSWDNAMKHFRCMSDEHTELLIDAMVLVFLREIDDDINTANAIANLPESEVRANSNSWFNHCAKQKHHLQAAAICKLNAEKGK